MNTQLTVKGDHGFNSGDIICITKIRETSKFIAFFVGIYYYNKLPRSFGAFIRYETWKNKIISVDNETTVTID